MNPSCRLWMAVAGMTMVLAIGGCVRNGVKPGDEHAGEAHPAPGETGTERDDPQTAPQFAFSTKGAEAYQKAYADYRDVPVERDNVIGMRLALSPPPRKLRGSVYRSAALVMPLYTGRIRPREQVP